MYKDEKYKDPYPMYKDEKYKDPYPMYKEEKYQDPYPMYKEEKYKDPYPKENYKKDYDGYSCPYDYSKINYPHYIKPYLGSHYMKTPYNPYKYHHD